MKTSEALGIADVSVKTSEALFRERKNVSMKKIILTIMVAFGSLFGVNLQTLVDECKNDNFASCSDVGTVLYQAGELETAVQFWQKACDGKNPSGCQNLGVSYHFGQGVEKDSKKAYELWNFACNANEYNACYNLGNIYKEGVTVQKNDIKARNYYDKACNKNIWLACYSLGDIYIAEGQNVQINAMGIDFYKKACENGKIGISCFKLGNIYDKGIIAKKSNSKAENYYKQACQNGFKDACEKVRN